jgi:hypothetical protein
MHQEDDGAVALHLDVQAQGGYLAFGPSFASAESMAASTSFGSLSL